MIKIDDLKESDIGKWVKFDTGHYLESGRLKSWNDTFVFIVFDCNKEWFRFKDYTGCSCNPDNCTFFEDGE